MANVIKATLKRIIEWASPPLPGPPGPMGMPGAAGMTGEPGMAASKKLIQDEIAHKLSALQAIDVNFRDTGKVIIIARVGGQDIVKIIDVPKNVDMNVYRHMVQQIEASYGAKPRFVDGPYGTGLGAVKWTNND